MQFISVIKCRLNLVDRDHFEFDLAGGRGARNAYNDVDYIQADDAVPPRRKLEPR